MKRKRTSLRENPIQPTYVFLGGLFMGFLGGLAAATLTATKTAPSSGGTVGSFASIEKNKVSEGTKTVHPVLQRHG